MRTVLLLLGALAEGRTWLSQTKQKPKQARRAPPPGAGLSPLDDAVARTASVAAWFRGGPPPRHWTATLPQQLPGRRVAGTGHGQEGVRRAEPHRCGAEDTSHARRRPAADLGRGALPRVFEREGGRPQTARSLAGEAERVLRGAALECSAGRELGAVRGVVENVSGPAARDCGITHRGRPVVRRRGLLRRGALSGRARVQFGGGRRWRLFN